MFEVENVKDFLNKRFGWLTPEGDLLVCAMHNHYAVLGEKYRTRYRELVDQHEATMTDILYSEQSDLSDDEYYHPAMHRFDPQNDAARDLENELYGEGYLRLGILMINALPVLDVYGSRFGVEKHKTGIDFLFDVGDFDRVLVTVPGSLKAKVFRNR